MATISIFRRKKDLAYLIFFALHIPIMFRKPYQVLLCLTVEMTIYSLPDREQSKRKILIKTPVVDLTPLYPTALKPQFLTDLRGWYITTYRDQFFSSPP